MDGDHGQSPMLVIPVPPPPPPPPEPRLLVPIPSRKEAYGKRRKERERRDERDNGDEPPQRTQVLFIAIAVLVLLFILMGGGWYVGYGGLPGGWGGWMRPHRTLLACPRPPVAAEGQPQFNEQQILIRQLRRQAFRGDFFAQLELARRYEGKRDSDKNLQDQVEAATWYALALANPEGYEATSARTADGFGPRLFSLYDDCRHGERQIAYQGLDRLLSQMSTDERDKVRDRATYVLSTQGAIGFRTLGRLHDVAFGPFGEPGDDLQALQARTPAAGWPDAVRLFERNGVDAYMFNYLAMQQGDEGSYVLLQDLQRSIPWPGFADIAEQRARRWTPPYEFYPADAPESGVPHSDESEPLGEADRVALYRIGELPFKHIADALTYLHVISSPCDSERGLSTHDVQTFQAMIGRPATGWLTPLEKVRIIQFAAVNGSPRAQLVLAVMYAQGVGVAPDYARAFHWFEEADRQGSPEAKFAVATYFSEGLAGVADQQKAEAVVHQLDAALSGFRPSTHRLSAMLDRVGGGHRGWYGYARPEEESYPEDGDRYGYGGQGSGRPPPPAAEGPPGLVNPGAGGGPVAYAEPGRGGGEDWSSAAGDTRRIVGRHYGVGLPRHEEHRARSFYGRSQGGRAMAMAGARVLGAGRPSAASGPPAPAAPAKEGDPR